MGKKEQKTAVYAHGRSKKVFEKCKIADKLK